MSYRRILTLPFLSLLKISCNCEPTLPERPDQTCPAYKRKRASSQTCPINSSSKNQDDPNIKSKCFSSAPSDCNPSQKSSISQAFGVKVSANCPCDSNNNENDQSSNQKTIESSKYQPEELTHHFLLKQAASVTVDAVTRLITESISALDDYHQQYRVMLQELIRGLEDSRSAIGANQELIHCKMIVLRSQMEDIKKNIIEIESFLNSVECLAAQASQTAYLARSEYPSIALAERLQSAMFEAKRIKETTSELEKDMIQLQAVLIVESGNSLK